MKRWTTLAAAMGLAAFALAACGDDEAGKESPNPDTAAEENTPSTSAAEPTADDLNDELLRAIRTKPKEGGELVAEPEQLSLTLPEGDSALASTVLQNTGDEPVTITDVAPLIPTDSLQIMPDGCAAGRVLEPQQACRIAITWEDDSGRNVNTGILVTSDARQTPRITLPVNVTIEVPPAPETPDCPAQTVNICGAAKSVPALDFGAQHPLAGGHSVEQTMVCTRQGLKQTQRSGQCEPPAPKAKPQSGATADMIMRARTARLSSGLGQGFNRVSRTHERSTVREETGYDRSIFDSVDTSLPVDRSRILTEDRIIKAVLESPVSNVMCGRVTAQVESNVYAPEGTQILIPAGSRFIGECAEFMNDRSGGRAMINWRRFITPNGVSARLIANTADANGLGGVPGNLRQHWIDRYGIPLAFSALNAMVTFGLSDGTSTATNLETGVQQQDESPATQAVDQFTEDARGIAGQVADELQNVPRTLVIPSGSRFDITLTQDIYFKSPYEVVTLDGERFRMAGGSGTSGRLEPAANVPGTVTINGQTYRPVADEADQNAAPNRSRREVDRRALGETPTYPLNGMPTSSSGGQGGSQ